MTRADWDLWKLEHDLVVGLVEKIEAAEHAILAGLKLPPSLEAAVDAIRNGQIKRGATERDRRRASHAIVVLVQLRKVRANIGPQGGNARGAAHAALLAGLYAGDSAIVGIEKLLKAKKGGAVRGTLSSDESRGNRARVKRALRLWQMSETLRDEWNDRIVPFVCDKEKLSAPTVREHLRALGHHVPVRRRRKG